MQENRFKYNFVMLVDDDDIANFMHGKLIEIFSFAKKVQANNKPQEALDFLKQLNESGSVYPQVFFIDLNMPLMDGFELLSQMKNLMGNKFNESKTVVLTSSVDQNDKKRIELISENILFFNKPLTQGMLGSL